MKTTKYAIKNAKGMMINRVDSEAEALAIVNSAKGIRYGWTIKAFTEETLDSNTAVWEIEGNLADPNAVEWNSEEY